MSSVSWLAVGCPNAYPIALSMASLEASKKNRCTQVEVFPRMGKKGIVDIDLLALNILG